MPRAKRAYGRPGTRVFPLDWDQSHAPVATKTMPAKCQLLPPGTGELAFDEAEHVSKRTPVEPTYDDVCRIQQLSTQEGEGVTGDQAQSTASYLITIRFDGAGADEITLAHTVKVTECPDDPSLVTTALRIERIGRGTHRFERDLFCTEDQSAPAR